MSQKLSEEKMREMAEACKNIINDASVGFAVLSFDLGNGGYMSYIANAQREDMIKAMKEFIANSESDPGFPLRSHN